MASASPNPNPSPSKSSSAAWLGFAFLLAVFAGAAALTWRKWPDLTVDFGMQLYLPWKISTGSVLYRDLSYLTGGPFSQYFNATLFNCFGTSLLTLTLANLILALALLGILYHQFRKSSDLLTSLLAGLVLVLGFTFNQLSEIGNFNYITPYCHEVWHGLVLSTVAVICLSRWLESKRPPLLVIAGLCTGLVFMTKPDVFLALFAAIIASLGLSVKTNRKLLDFAKSLSTFLVVALIPLLFFAAYFHRFESWSASWRSVAFAWVPIFSSPIAKSPFYQWCLGLDAPWVNLKWMGVQFLIIAAAIALCVVAFRNPLNTVAKRVVAMSVIAALILLASKFNWIDCGRSLPILSLLLLATLLRNYLRSHDVRLIFPLLWSVFGFALLAKLGLYPRVWHYGFALAMPATLSAIYLLTWTVPQACIRFGLNLRLYRSVITVIILLGFIQLFLQSQYLDQKKTLPVGTGKDRILAFDAATDPRDADVAEAVSWITNNTSPQATLAVLPEGVMLNYLSRRTNPTHYYVWNPPELSVFGQTAMTTDFEHHAPDYVVLLHRDASEYGAAYFGKQERFGRELLSWIESHYEPVKLIGAEPLKNGEFGVKILRRRVSAGSGVPQ